MKCIVTGGAGFIGSHLVELLISEGHQVTVIDNLISGNLENLKNIQNDKNFTFINADIRYKDSLSNIDQKVDCIFHLAGLADIVPSIEMPQDYFDTNVTGTFNMLQFAKKLGVKKFVYAASSSSYGIPNKYPTNENELIQPLYPYALTKHLGEELVLHWAKVYSISSLSLRLFNVYGVRSRTSGVYGAVFGVFLAQKLNNKPLTVVGDGRQTRDFTYVTDVVRAFYLAAKSSLSGEAMNVGSGNHYSVNRIVELLGSNKVIYIPKRPGEPDCTFADTTKIKNKLHWYPKISLEEGVSMLLENIEYWRNAPVWDEKKIKKATESWFKYLTKENQ